MDKYGSSKFSVESFSYRKMNRRIRQAIVSTQKMCEHRKDIPSTCLMYKQYRQPIWRLKYNTSYTDERFKWPKSRRIVNLLSDPYRKMFRNPVSEDGFLFTLPISSVLRTRPKLSIRDRRPLRSPPLCLRRHSPPRLVVPLPPLRRFHVMQVQPLRSLTRDYPYLYDTLTGRTTESADLAFRTRLMSRISSYAFPLLDEQPRSPRQYARTAESLYGTYATKLMEEEAAQQYQRRSRFASRNGDFEIKQPQLMLSSKVAIKSLGESIRRRINKISPPSYVPKTLNSRVGRPEKPFLPNRPVGPGNTTVNYRNKTLDKAISDAYTWIPKMSRRFIEPEVVSNDYRPKTFLSSDFSNQSLSRFESNGITFRRYALKSELLPVTNDDITLRLRLAYKLSPEGLSHLYPNEKLILNNLPTIEPRKTTRRRYDDEETIEEIIRSTKTYSKQKETKSTSIKMPFFFTRTAFKPLTPRKTIDYEHLYPSTPPKSTHAYALRPLPGANLKLSISRLSDRIKSKFDEEVSDSDLEPSRLLTSANNYSRLYVSHPENLPSSELGQHLKLSLRSSTSKVASLYASHPVRRTSPPPIRRKKIHNPLSTRIPDKYLPEAYVPRPGILSASRVGSNLHGLL